MKSQRFVGSATELGPREIGVIASTSQLARDGDVIVPAGIDLTEYRKNPIVLFQHDHSRPIGMCTAVGVENGSLAAKIKFAPQGVSADADLVCNLAKGGILKGISIGFVPTESEPLDSHRPYGGQRITAADLLEISVVSAGADPGALVTARSFAAIPGAMRILRSLPPTTQSARARAEQSFQLPTQKPVGLMNPYERARFYTEVNRMRTMTAWAAGQAYEAERDARWSYETRQAELAELERKCDRA